MIGFYPLAFFSFALWQFIIILLGIIADKTGLKAKKRFCDAMDDDLNTADAISAIFDIVSVANKNLSQDGNNAKKIVVDTLSMIHELGDVLGLFEEKEEQSVDSEIEALIEKRNEARKNKDWAEADRIRDELKARNIILKDTPMGVKWSYAE